MARLLVLVAAFVGALARPVDPFESNAPKALIPTAVNESDASRALKWHPPRRHAMQVKEQEECDGGWYGGDEVGRAVSGGARDRAAH